MTPPFFFTSYNKLYTVYSYNSSSKISSPKAFLKRSRSSNSYGFILIIGQLN